MTQPEPCSVNTTVSPGCRSSTPPQIMCGSMLWVKKPASAKCMRAPQPGCGAPGVWIGTLEVADIPPWELTIRSSSSNAVQIGSNIGWNRGNCGSNLGSTAPLKPASLNHRRSATVFSTSTQLDVGAIATDRSADPRMKSASHRL